MVGMTMNTGQKPPGWAVETHIVAAPRVSVKPASSPKCRRRYDFPSARAVASVAPSREQRQRILLANAALPRAEQVRDAVGVVADEGAAMRQHGEAIARAREDAAHPQHAVRAIERLLDRAVAANDAPIELHQMVAQLAHARE